MKSMRFLSLSLLVVAFGSSVFAMDSVGDHVSSLGDNNNNNNNNNTSSTTSRLLNSRGNDTSYGAQALSTMKNLSSTHIGIGLSVVALTTGVVLYKKNAKVKAYADAAYTVTKSKLPEKNKKNAIIAAGSVTTLAGLVVAYKYGLVSKAVKRVSSYFGTSYDIVS